MASMDSAAPESDWKESILTQIQNRNLLERTPFLEFYTFHNNIFESWNSMRWEAQSGNILESISDPKKINAKQEAELSKLKMKCLAQADELIELHKTKSENANLVVSLNEELRAMENVLEQKNERIAELNKKENLLKQELEDYRILHDQMEKKFQILKDENQALVLNNTHLEEKLRKTQTENCEMIERIKEYKSKDAERMNQENEIFLRKKDALVQQKIDEASRDTKYTFVDGGSIDDMAFDALDLNPGSGNLPSSPSIIWDAHDGEVNSIQFNPVSEYVLATGGGSDRVVKLWDTCRGKAMLKCQLVGSNKGIMAVEFDNSGTLILATSADSAIRVWGVNEQRPRSSLTGHSKKVLAAKFYQEQTKVVSGSYDRTIKFWDLNRLLCFDTIFPPSCCNDLIISDSLARTVISGHIDKTVKFWDNRQLGTLKKEPVQEINLGDKVTSLCLTKDGKRLLACVRDDSLKIIDPRENQVIRTLSAEGFVACCDHTRASLSADCEYAAVGSQDGNIYIWNTHTGKLEQTLKQHQSAVIAVAWHPCNNGFLASVDKNKKAILWTS